MNERLDILLVERRLVESRTKAQWLIRNGYALVNGFEIKKPGKRVDNTCQIQLKAKFPYISMNGLKLDAALENFSISVKEKVCADIGSSVGGFVDCLLKHGALRVYAIDTATDLLHPSLRCEKMKNQVIALLGVDARLLKNLDELVDVCTVHITFTSLKDVIPNIKNYLKPNGDIITLIKPLFKTKFREGKKFQMIQDPQRVQKILIELLEWSIHNEIFPYGLIKSPILGKGGSIEFLVHFKVDKISHNFDYRKAIESVI
jgi:23S rRNA (cytidine1920-2'-O)/16S rRNA (cytidine1409-2'-O)-methyltransferase